MEMTTVTPQGTLRQRLWELARLFAKLGAISFGGPAAHVALMEHEIVHGRRWLSRDNFLDLVAASNLIPGPNATELAIHIGYLRADWPGLAVAGVAFIVPALLITLALAWAYTTFGALPQASAILYGIKPAVLSIIVMAVYRLRSAIKNRTDLSFFALVLAGAALGANEVLLLFAAGLLMILWQERERLPRLKVLGLALPLGWQGWQWAAPGTTHPRLHQIFLYFVYVGSVLYGTGLVLYAFIQRDVVAGLGWLTQQQFIDAIAAGQVTPGPVLTSATFIGYLLGGVPGALVATAGVFGPSFLLVMITGPFLPRLRRWRAGQAFLRGTTVASLALICKTGALLGGAAVIDVPTALIALGSLWALYRLKADAIVAIAGGALAGLVHMLLVR